MKGAQQKASTSYAAKHATKAKPKVAHESIGKMTQFRNLDDIPDAMGEYDWEHSETNNHLAPIDQSFESYQIKSVKLDSSLDNELVGGPRNGNSTFVGSNHGKVPPLPYDQSRPTISKPAPPVGTNVAAPASKYFDYDHGADDFDDDALQAPSPKKAIRLVQQDAQYGASAPPLPAPPLPCDVKPNNSDADSIYFSKKPRPVEFKLAFFICSYSCCWLCLLSHLAAGRIL